jgi:hypothetical protein
MIINFWQQEMFMNKYCCKLLILKNIANAASDRLMNRRRHLVNAFIRKHFKLSGGV